MDWHPIRDIHPPDAVLYLQRMREAGLEARVVGTTLEARAPGLEKALEFVSRVQHWHKRIVEGGTAQPYKPLEFDRLVIAAWVGLRADPARLLHELVWSQALPNGNHRTALVAIEQRLFPAGAAVPPEPVRVACARRFIEESKPLVGEQGMGPAEGDLKARHHDAARRFIACLNRAIAP